MPVHGVAVGGLRLGMVIAMKAPFPYFGGKTKIASRVWAALGDVGHYIEPFFGSGAVLLARPAEHARKIETVCDKDGFICNVWRAMQFAPNETAKWCDWPVNHADLNARRKELIKNEDRLLAKLAADTSWFDPKMAGYWIWAASCWIGHGLTSSDGIPHISHGGKGVHAIGQIPHISGGGKGVHAIGKRREASDEIKGVNEPYNVNIYQWFRQLSERLRYVRVVCGDWTRVCGGNWQDNNGICGMFFDPPYGVKDRAAVYHCDGTDIAAAVMAWCRERGASDRYRIILAGYEEYMDLVENHGWTCEQWSADGGYSGQGKKTTRGKDNRHREHLYFSPHCLNHAAAGYNLFSTPKETT